MTYDYKCNSKCKRTKDGLIAHHKKEDLNMHMIILMEVPLESDHLEVRYHHLIIFQMLSGYIINAQY